MAMSSEAAAASSSEEVEEAPETQIPVPAEMQSDLEMTSPAVRVWISKRREVIRPWSDFFKTSHLEVPRSPGRLGKRVVKNLEHFQSNYVVVFLALSLYCFVADPLLIVAVAAFFITCWLLKARQRQRKLMLANHEVTLAHQCSVVAILFSVPVLLLTGFTSAVFCGFTSAVFCVILHASLYNFDALEAGNCGDGEALLTGHITSDTEEV